MSDICACTSTINKFTRIKISFYLYNVDIFSYYNNNYYGTCTVKMIKIIIVTVKEMVYLLKEIY